MNFRRDYEGSTCVGNGRGNGFGIGGKSKEFAETEENFPTGIEPEVWCQSWIFEEIWADWTDFVVVFDETCGCTWSWKWDSQNVYRDSVWEHWGGNQWK